MGRGAGPGTPLPPAERPRMEPDGSAPKHVQAFIAALDEVDLARFRVVGA